MLSKGRVLLVDDEPLVLEMFESILTQEGFDVHVAPNAKEALQYIERTVFDVLVCDVKLEDLDGFDIMAIVRKKTPGVAVVLVTGAPSAPDAEIAAENNAAYLSKPIGLDLLVSTVEQSLRRKAAGPKDIGKKDIGTKQLTDESLNGHVDYPA